MMKKASVMKKALSCTLGTLAGGPSPWQPGWTTELWLGFLLHVSMEELSAASRARDVGGFEQDL